MRIALTLGLDPLKFIDGIADADVANDALLNVSPNRLNLSAIREPHNSAALLFISPSPLNYADNVGKVSGLVAVE